MESNVPHLVKLKPETDERKTRALDMLELLRRNFPLYLPIEKIDYLVDGLLCKGMLTIVSGKGGSGKSTLVHYWCKALLENHDVLYLDRDNSKNVIQEDMQRLYGSSRPRNFFYWADWLKDDEGKDLPVEDIGDPVIDMIDNMHNPIVVIDTLRTFARCEENSNTEMSSYIALCKNLTKRHNATVIIIHHQNKAGTSACSGAGSIESDADNVLWLTSEKNDDNSAITKITITPAKGKVLLRRKVYSMVDGVPHEESSPNTNDRLMETLKSHPGISQDNLIKLANSFASQKQVREFVATNLMGKRIERKKAVGKKHPLLYVSDVACQLDLEMEEVGDEE